MRVQSWASPPVTREWLSHCAQHPGQTGPWGQRRSACHPQTESRRGPTGPHWKAGGSGGGTHGKCSRGHPGYGGGRTWSEVRRTLPGHTGWPSCRFSHRGQVRNPEHKHQALWHLWSCVLALPYPGASASKKTVTKAKPSKPGLPLGLLCCRVGSLHATHSKVRCMVLYLAQCSSVSPVAHRYCTGPDSLQSNLMGETPPHPHRKLTSGCPDFSDSTP
jgi:hypothetical protein